MEQTIQKIPFLRLTIALSIGIIIDSYANFSVSKTLAGTCLAIGVLFLIQKKYNYKLVTLFGLTTQIIFIFFGIIIFELYNKKPVFQTHGTYFATVLEIPQEKEKTYKSLLQIFTVQRKDTFYNTSEKILVYFEKHETATKLKPGNTIIFKQSPQLIKNFGNPFEFDYKKYLERKKIYRQVYLSDENWKITNKIVNNTIATRAELLREKLLSNYRRQKFDKNELEILSALTLGYKRELDPETKRVFSSAGAMHVLAVSGLHVGIIFWLLTISFGFLQKQKNGKILFIIISIVALWVYAFITGMTPSVQRSATMFSLFVIGNNLKRQLNIYNTLAATALIMLLLNPNNLYEIGFQLSFSAIFGIVYLQPKFSKVIVVKSKIGKYLWTLLTVSLAAQISTFPITSFYFNQFPTYFWLTNMLVIPSVMVLIPLGITLLLLSKIPIISTFLAFILNYFLKFIYYFLQLVDQLPYSVQEISVQSFQLVLIVCILLSFLLLLKTPRPYFIKSALTFIFLFILFSSVYDFANKNKTQLLVYNNPGNSIVHLIKGKKNYIISEKILEGNESCMNAIQNAIRKGGLNDMTAINKSGKYEDNFLFNENGIIHFEGKTILLNTNLKQLSNKCKSDYIINPVSSENIDFFCNPGAQIIVNEPFLASNINGEKKVLFNKYSPCVTQKTDTFTLNQHLIIK